MKPDLALLRRVFRALLSRPFDHRDSDLTRLGRYGPGRQL